MAAFCTNCGSPVSGRFCVKCGADTHGPAASPSPTPALSVQAPAPPPTANPVTTTSKGSPLAKILIGLAVVIVAIGAMAVGGVYYVAHRVNQRVHEIARDVPILGQIPGGKPISSSDSSSGDDDSSEEKKTADGGVCRFLSKEEVSKAIGVEIVAAEGSSKECSYLAHGNSADMTAKHMSAMVGAKGGDGQARKMTEQVAGGLFNAMRDKDGDPNQNSSGNVPVVTFQVDTNAAEVQMRLNAKVMGNLGPGPQGLAGIGDQAFDVGGAMVMMRKGDKLVRIMYSMCPCTVEGIKPLAKKLADSM
jgi:hypothetical protein